MVAGEVELYVDGFAVLAFCARRRQRVSPEVLHMLDMRRVGLELTHHGVVVPVRIVVELVIAFQHDHRETVGVRLFELLPMRSMASTEGASLGLSETWRCFRDLIQRWNGHAQQEDNR